MRVHVDDLPRMESTSTSSTARSVADFGMFPLPPFQTREGRFFVRRVRDHQKRRPRPWLLRGGFLRRGAGARRRHARRFALHLAKVWRPGRVAETCRLVFRRELEQLFERTWRGVHACVRIAELREALGNREHGEIGRVAVGDLMPVKRRGHAGVGNRAHGIGGAGRAVLGVLVVVEEHAVTLLLPPLRAGQRR